MNKIYIIHCWDGTKDDGWYPWLDFKISAENGVDELTEIYDKALEMLNCK